MNISLVIPCYNEASSLPILIDKCERLVETNPDLEIILVDNGSTDDSPGILKSLESREAGVRSTRVDKNIGYGNGILAGLEVAKSDVIGWTHADLQTDPADVLAAADIYDQSNAPENLFIKGARTGRPFSDVIFTVGMAVFETVFMRTRMWDINAQPTLMHRSLYSKWINPPVDFSLDLYAYYQAKKNRAVIRRIPVHFGPRTFGESHWNTGIAAKLKFIRRTLSYSWNLRKELSRSSNQ